MSENETILLNLIRENDKPSEALAVAIDIISSFLRQHGSSQSPSAVDLQESC